MMVNALGIITFPLSKLMQYIGRKESPLWYQFVAVAVFICSHFATYVWEVHGSGFNGKYVECNDAHPTVLVVYFVIRFKDLGFLLV
jgi:hypothetical protein